MHGKMERRSTIKDLSILDKALLGKWSKRCALENNFFWKYIIFMKFGKKEGLVFLGS